MPYCPVADLYRCISRIILQELSSNHIQILCNGWWKCDQKDEKVENVFPEMVVNFSSLVPYRLKIVNILLFIPFFFVGNTQNCAYILSERIEICLIHHLQFIIFVESHILKFRKKYWNATISGFRIGKLCYEIDLSWFGISYTRQSIVFSFLLLRVWL